MDLLLYDKCRREPNLTLYLNTTVVSAVVEDGLIREVQAERPSTEDAFVIRAKTFVDCTGDGRIGIEAGAPFMRGRESKAQFGESLAQDEPDTKTLGSSIMFQARKRDRVMPFEAPPWARRFSAEDFKLRPYGQSGFDLGLEYGYWWIEWGGCLDTLKDNERIRDELLAITLGVWDFVKNHSDIDASHWALEWIGFVPGKRESRRFIGQHILTENDLLTSRAFPRCHRLWRLAHRHPSAGRRRCAGAAALHAASSALHLRHPAALLRVHRSAQPDVRWPQPLRHAHRLRLHPRHGHLCCYRTRRRHRRSARFAAKRVSPPTSPPTRNSFTPSSSDSCAMIAI
jgi:hypothetical protein